VTVVERGVRSRPPRGLKGDGRIAETKGGKLTEKIGKRKEKEVGAVFIATGDETDLKWLGAFLIGKKGKVNLSPERRGLEVGRKVTEPK